MAGPGGGGRVWFVQVNAEGAEARRAKRVKTEEKGRQWTRDAERAACRPVGQTRLCVAVRLRGWSLRPFSEVEARRPWGPSVTWCHPQQLQWRKRRLGGGGTDLVSSQRWLS